MCGIAGKLYLAARSGTHGAAPSVDPALLERMHRVLAHRGPDDVGIYHDGPVGLAFRRLAIIDLSPGGHQPMSNADGTLWIVFNGEIYNFREQRARLEREGVVFRSRSDTEVILALYERHGVECLQHLRGMFAMAIWDARRRELFLARDRAGKKPLHYYLDDTQLVFGSEPKAILMDPSVPVEADRRAIHHYLTLGYVPSPFSAFRGVAKLPPAHYLHVKDGVARVERYWRLRYDAQRSAGEDELAEEIRTRLRDAVRARLISDVPLGAFLSGGIDSSAVVALMSETIGRVKTFSIGFEEDEYNELPYARLVAERYGTDHHEFVVKPDAMAVLPDLVWHYNEPFADSSAIPTYYLSKMTREHVTVALNGDGGDECFGGYPRYIGSRVASQWDAVPLIARRAIARVAAALPTGSTHGLYQQGRRFLAAGDQDPRRRYARWVGYFTNEQKAETYSAEFAQAMAGTDSIQLLLDAYAAVPARDFVDTTLGVDVATYLPDDLLVKVDIASMAHSLEARSPMVDHEFMEFAASIPSRLKVRGRTTKYLFKAAVRPLLPAAVIDRRKMGFGVPIDHWFRHELRDLTHDTLLGTAARQRGLFRPDGVKRLLDEHLARRANRHHQLWALLFLELWFQRFIDTRP